GPFLPYSCRANGEVVACSPAASLADTWPAPCCLNLGRDSFIALCLYFRKGLTSRLQRRVFACETLPASHRHIDIARVQLDPVGPSADALGCNDSRAGPHERVEHD